MEAPHYTLYVRLGGAVAGMVGCGEENLSHPITEIGHWKAQTFIYAPKYGFYCDN
jgi:hypothetical protein